MKYKNFIRRMLAGVLSVLILLGDVGSLGVSAWAAEPTPTEITEQYDPGLVQTDTVPDMNTLAQTPTEQTPATVSEGDTAAATETAEDPAANNENIPSSEEKTEEEAEDTEADAAGTDGSDTATKATDSSDVEAQEPVESDPAKQEAEPAEQPQQPQQNAGEAQEEAKDPSALSVEAKTDGSRYATANVSAIKYSAVVAGGTAPYQVHFSVKLGGAVCNEQTVQLAMPGNSDFSYIPVSGGVHDVTIIVTDSVGTVAVQTASMPVSNGLAEDYEAALSYVTISGDWATDVMNMAIAQIGKSENQLNFIIDEENNYHYYSIYGDSYGEPYADWSALFAAFCLKMAKLPAEAMPVDKDAEKFAALLNDKGIYRSAAEYEPVPGDIAFLTEGRVGVVSVAGNGEVYIIWGGPSVTVKQDVLQQTDPIILGYGSIALAKDVYENGPIENTEEKVEEKTEEKTEYTVTINATQSTAAMGEFVTLTAVLPEGLSADELLFTWQMYSETNGWMEIEDAYEQSYSFTVDALHLLNDIRVNVRSMPAIAPMAMMRMAVASASVEAEEDEPLDISSSVFSLNARSTGEIYWNPYDEPIFNEDGLIIVGAGNDTNSGAEDAPVLTINKAIELAGAGAIVCMNLLDVYDADPSDNSLSTEFDFMPDVSVTMKGYAGNEYDGSAHDGIFFSVKSGQMKIKNLIVADSRSMLELDGGAVVLCDGINMPGYIFLNSPTRSVQPITIDAANGANEGAYIINFNSSYSGKVGIAKGEHANDGMIQLADALENKGWVLINENGNTFAHIPPEYEAVYVDGIYGDDSNDGNSANSPVKSLGRAEQLISTYKEKIKAVYIMSTVSLDADSKSCDGDTVYTLSYDSNKVPAVRYGSAWSGPMFKVIGGSHTLNISIDGQNSSQPVLQAVDGTLSIDNNISFANCSGILLQLNGGAANVTGMYIAHPYFVSGSGTLTITDSSINTGSNIPVSLSGGFFSSSGSRYTSSSATTISMASGTASFSGDTFTVSAADDQGEGGIGSIVGANVSFTGTDAVRMSVNNVTAFGTLSMEYTDAETVTNTGRSTLNFSSAASLETGSAVINNSTVEGDVNATTGDVEARESTLKGNVDARTAIKLIDSPVSGNVNAQGNVSVQNTAADKGDVGGSITAGGTGTLEKLRTESVIITGVATISDVTVTGDVTVQNRATITGSSMENLQTSGKATITDSTITASAKTAAADISGGSIKTFTASGTTTISNGANIENATTPAVTVSGAESKVTSLTASGNVTLTGGTVDTLTANANVTANNAAAVTVTKLILKGNNSVFSTDGTAKAGDITLQGANAYIKLSNTPAGTGDINISITSPRGKRLVVDSTSNSFNAAALIKNTVNPNGRINYVESSAQFWLAADTTDPNDIVIGSVTGVYVSSNPALLHDGNSGLTPEQPVASFAEAIEILKDSLKKDSDFPKYIYVVDYVSVGDGDWEDPGVDVTVMAHSTVEGKPLITIPENCSFAPTKANFDGAGVSTLFDVDGSLTLSGSKLINCGTAIDNSGTVSGSATIDTTGTAIINSGSSLSITGSITAGGTGIDTEAGTVTITGSIEAAGKGVEMAAGKLTVTKGITAGGIGLDMDSGEAIVSGGIKAGGKGAEVTLGKLTLTGDVTASGTGIDMGVGANVLAYNGGKITVSGGSSASGISMGDGTATIRNADITVTNGTGLNIKGGTVTASDSNTITVSSGTGVVMMAGKLDYSGSIYGSKGITVSGGTVDFRGGRCTSGSSSYTGGTVTVSGNGTVVNMHSGIVGAVQQSSGTVNVYTGADTYNYTDYSQNYVYTHTITGGTTNVEGNVKTLSQRGGTVNVKSGYVGSMSQSAGESNMIGGEVETMSFTGGTCNVSGNGYIDYISTMSGGLTATKLNVSGGRVDDVSQRGGTTMLTGGTIGTATINAADTAAKIYANGGNLNTCRLYADNAILHTNGQCNIGEVYLGEVDSAQDKGANAYLALSGPVKQSGKIYIIAGDANYYEGYPVVRPDPSAENGGTFDASEYIGHFSINRMKKRFNLAVGSGDNARCIVLSFAGVFIDTQNGDDTNDGLSVETAVKTFKRASTVMNAQEYDFIPVIYVVDKTNRSAPATAVVSGDDTLNTNSKSNGQVYVAPFAGTCNTLIEIPDGASLTVSNTDLDGEGNNAGSKTSTVVKVAGSLTMSGGSDIINGRSTVLDIASTGKVELNSSLVRPSDDCYSSATSVKLQGGELKINSGSSVRYGKLGVDMNGGTLNVIGQVNYSRGAGISVQGSSIGAEITVSGTVSSNGDGIEVLSGASNTAINISGDVRNNSYNGIDIASGTTGTQLTLTNANIDSNTYSGVVMASGTATMSGGSVNSNSRGGVSLSGGTFTQNSGEIKYNGAYISGSTISSIRSNAASGISVSGGTYNLVSGTVSYNGSTGNGGGINHTGGTLEITNATVEDNSARSNGGGLYAGAGASLRITNITLRNNVSTGGNGGGLYYDCGANAAISKASITGNKAESGNGGGIYIKGSSAEHSHVFGSGFTITGNKARNGSGVYSACRTALSFEGCVLNNNLQAGQHGGSIYVENADVTIGSTIATDLGNNSAGGDGGAIYMGGGKLTLGEKATLGTGTAGSDGGLIYKLGSGDIEIHASAQLGKGTAENGNGGLIYISGSGNIKAQNNTTGFEGSAENGGLIYYASSGSSSNLAGSDLSGTAGNDGGVVYIGGSGSITLGNNDADTGSITGTAGGDGGAIYKAGSGTVTVNTGSSIKGTAANGDGGVVYLYSGTATLNGAVVGKAGEDENNALNGGLIYVNSGTTNLNNITRLGEGESQHKFKALEDGGAIYVNSGTVSLTEADLGASTAKNGGAVYVKGGTVTLDQTIMDKATATAQGGAVYAEGGTVSYMSASTTDAKAGTNTEGSTDNDFGTVYVGLDAKFDHVSGAITGNVQSAGDYTVTLSADSKVAITGGIELLTGTKPLVISEASTSGYTGKIKVTVDTGFMDGTIVKGTSTVPARYHTGTINIEKNSSLTWTERGNDIIGPVASDVFWDPNMASSYTKDENNGADANTAVLTFERAKDLLALRGPTARIILCSPSVYCTMSSGSGGVPEPGGPAEPGAPGSSMPSLNGDGNVNGSVYSFDGEIVCTEAALKGRTLTADQINELKSKEHFGKTWDATIIRNDGEEASGYMFAFNYLNLDWDNAPIPSISNMTISGEFLSGKGTTTGALIGTTLGLTVENVTLKNNTSTKGGAIYCETTRSVERKIINSTISNCSATYGGAIYTDGGDLKLSATSISGCTAVDGAAIFSKGGFTIIGGSFSNNHATGTAPQNQYAAPIYAEIYFEINPEMVNERSYSTIFENNSGAAAGAIVAINGATINNTKFVGNNGGTADSQKDAGALLSLGYTYINYSLFENNVAEEANGGAIAAYYGIDNQLALYHTDFIGNKTKETGSGGAVYLGSGIELFQMDYCKFEGNSAAESGGALYMAEDAYFDSSPLYCTFKNNIAKAGSGGAIYANQGVGFRQFNNITFTGNSADSGFGGAIYAGDGAPYLYSCEFEGNHADNGAAMYCGNGEEVLMDVGVENKANTFIGNYTSTDAADKAIVYLKGPAVIKHIIMGDKDATAFPESREAALASGGNASGNMLYSQTGYLRITDITAKGNYAPNAVISNGNAEAIVVLWDDMGDSPVYSEVSYNYTDADKAAIYYGGNEIQITGVKVNNNSASGVYCYASGDASKNRSLTISNSELNNNGKSGFIAEKNSGVTTLGESLSIGSSQFNGNKEYGAKLSIGVKTGGKATIEKYKEGITTSFNNNGIEGLYMECSTPNSNLLISLDGIEAKNNGKNNAEGRGLYVMPHTVGTSYYANYSVSNAVISGNGSAATEKGGGVYVASGAVVSMDDTVTISKNEAQYSGAIYWQDGGSHDGKGAKLIGNKASENGGAIYADQAAELVLKGFIIEDNEAKNGGGIYFAKTAPKLTLEHSPSDEENKADIDMILRGNKASGKGGAIYIEAHTESTAEVEETPDGEIIINNAIIAENESGDKNGYDTGFSSGIYNGGRVLNMAGSNVEISDNIYLFDVDYPIYLTGTMSRGSEYKVALNMHSDDEINGYHYDDTVIAPTGVRENTAIYLRYISPVLEGNVFAKGRTKIGRKQLSNEVDSVVLKRCFFVDSVKGTDIEEGGQTPGAGAFATMEFAIDQADKSESGAVIYVCGPVYPVENNWNPSSGIEIRRYTGFAIGGDVNQAFDPYYGDMIVVGAGHTVTGAAGGAKNSVDSLSIAGELYSIAGWHTANDAVVSNGSIFRVESGAKLSFTDHVELVGNNSNNNGGAIYIEENGKAELSDVELSALSAANGGAIYVENGAELSLNKVSFEDVSATNGGAIYTDGKLNVQSNTVTITGGSATNGGGIYVAENGGLDVNTALTIDGSATNGGGIYNEGTVTVGAALSINGTAGSKGSAIYHSGEESKLEFKGGSSIETDDVLFITDNAYVTMHSTGIGGYSNTEPLNMDIGDPRDGRVYVSYACDANFNTETNRYKLTDSITKSYKCSSDTDPATAIGKLDLVLSQTDVYYVGNDTNPNDNADLHEGWSADRPFATIQEALTKLGTNAGTIYIVDTVQVNENLVLDGSNGITIRRYSQPENKTFNNRSFKRESLLDALFHVASGKTLTLKGITIDGHDGAITNSGPNTKFTIAPAVEMSGPLVDVDGTLVLTGGASLSNNNSQSNEIDAADNGNIISIEGEAFIEGTVYLQAGKFISVTDTDTSPASDISILLDDTSDGRVIARYGDGNGAPGKDELGKYLLSEDVLKDYYLAIDGSDIVLRAKNRVYVHGGIGNDQNNGTPDSPIASMAEAYRRLRDDGGQAGTIYILGTVNISSNVNLYNNRFIQNEQSVVLPDNYKLTIKRYVQPTAKPEGFTAESFIDGALFNVANGGSLSVSNITVDGHGQPVITGNVTEIAGAVNPKAPLFVVNGTLNLDNGTSLQNNICGANTSGGAIRIAGSGRVNMREASIIRNNAEYGAGIWVSASGTLDIAGNPSFGSGDDAQWVFLQGSGNGISAIQVSAALSTKRVPVHLPDSAITYDTVIAEYAEGLEPDESVFDLTEDNYSRMAANIITKTVNGQQVILRKSYIVKYVLDGKDGSEENAYGTLQPMSNAPVLVARLTDLSTGITGDKDHMPLSVSVKITDPTSGAESDAVFSYDRLKGSIEIDGKSITGNVTVIANSLRDFTVTKVYEGFDTNDTITTSIIESTGFGGKLKLITGYRQPQSIEIKVGDKTLTEGVDYSYDSETLAVEVFDKAVTGDVTITAKAIDLYGVSYELGTGISVSGNTNPSILVPNEDDLNAYFTLDDAYEITSKVITINGQALTETQLEEAFDHSSDTGAITVSIAKTVINGDVHIELKTAIKTYSVTQNIPGATAVQDSNGNAIPQSGDSYKVDYGQQLDVTISKPEGYNYPETITVNIDGKPAASSEYNYDSATGKLTIYTGTIKGDVEIIGEAKVQTFDVITGVNPEKTASFTAPEKVEYHQDFTVTVNPDTGYRVETITVSGKGLDKAGSYTINGNTVTVNAGYVEGDVTISATTVKQHVISFVYAPAAAFSNTVATMQVDNNGSITTQTIGLAAGYKTPTVSIKRGDADAVADAWNNGVITVNNITGPVTVTISTELYTYTVSGTLNNISANKVLSQTVNYGSDFEITLTAADNYDLPASVTVSGAEHEYNSDTGVLTIKNITNDVTFSASGVPEKHDLTFNEGSLLTYSGVEGDNVLSYGTDYEGTIAVKSGVKGNVTKPGSVSVKIGTGPAQIIASDSTATTGIRYNQATGIVAIPGSMLTGDVVIDAYGVQTFTVTASCSNGVSNKTGTATTTLNSVNESHAASDYSIIFAAESMHVLPDSVSVKIGTGTAQTIQSSNATTGIRYNQATGTVTIPAAQITDNTTVSIVGVDQFTVSYVDSPTGSVTLPAAPAVVTENAEHTVSFTAKTGYTITGLSVAETSDSSKKLTEGTDYSFTNNTLSIKANVIKANLTVTVTAEKIKFAITEAVDEATVTIGTDTVPTSGDTLKVNYGENIIIQVNPETGYELPEKITVKVGNGTPVEYDVNPNTGMVTIPGSTISSGPIVIGGAAVPKTYEVTINTTNVSMSTNTGLTVIKDDGGKVTGYTVRHKENDITVTFSKDTGYSMPTSVNVKIGQDDTNGTSYTLTDGVLSIAKDNIVGPVTITATGIEETYTISYEYKFNGSVISGSGSTPTTGNKTYTASYSESVSAGPGYKIVGNICPDGVSYTANTADSYGNSTGGTVSIASKAISSNVTVILNLAKCTYPISETVSNADVYDNTDNRDNKLGDTGTGAKPDTITYGENLKIEIKPDDTNGYTYPEKVTVTIGETEYEDISGTDEDSGISYDPETGIITIPATMKDKDVPVVTGPVSITGAAELKTYTVTCKHTNLTVSYGETIIAVDKIDGTKEYTVRHGNPYGDATIILSEVTGYDLPSNVTVTIGGKDYTGFNYNNITGVITIPAAAITGDIVVTASGVLETYNVSYVFAPTDSKGDIKQDDNTVLNDNGVHENGLTFDTDYKTTITVARGYKINSISVKRNGSDLSDTEFSYTKASTGDTLSSELTINAVSTPGALTVTVNASKRTYSITEDVDDATVELDGKTVPETPGEDDPKVTDGEDIELVIKPDADHTYPDEITVTIPDPTEEDPDKTKDVTVKQGETDDETGIKYEVETDPDTGETTATVTIPGEKVTGPVEISGEAHQLFDVNVSIEPVKDAESKPDYDRTDSTNDVTVDGNGENKAVENHGYDKLKLQAQTGYTIVSIDVKVGENGTAVNIPVKTAGTATNGYSYDAKTGTLNIPATVKGSDNKDVYVITDDVYVTVNTERTRYDVEYTLKKENETEAKLQVKENYTEEGGNVPIHDENFVTYIEGINNTITLPESITVKIGGEELPAKDEDGNDNYTYISSGTDAGKIIIPGDKIKGDVLISAVGIESFKAVYSFSLTASETFVAGKSDYVLDLVTADSSNAVSLARLHGKSFKIESVTMPNGISLADKDDVTAVKATAGSTYANANFAITAGSNDLYDAKTSTTDKTWFSFAETASAANVTFSIHNANAITQTADAGTIVVKLKSAIGDEITLNITIKREAAQLNVTVPLVLVMKTNIDGGSVDMSRSDYAIDNNSSMRVQLTNAVVSDASTVMEPDNTTNALSGMVDKYRISFVNDYSKQAQNIAADGTAGKADIFKPISSIATSPLSFVTKDDAEYGLHMATVTYTVAIPADNLPDTAKP